ncbi:peptidylprolyl isomerase [Pseudoflavonifractor phocaeensis]|uniref:peptidylprolyl isomerase n=1 Tax=Pseudoflavonifractor phocaeensis TaxID=1870988 RepID=UPI00195BDF7D|nr:peptidylprolyl isomerase [Pseudoflavonifractor phocaeensis]MBM6869518.1 peptidylprolyl isomerase [Pseudoflavonifractor phocaeensis]
MPNPMATIHLSTGAVLVLELYPDIAPNAVTSFLYLARKGVFDGHAIERIVPGWVVDMSYHAFHDPAACYFIPNDVKSGRYLEAVFGTVGMGGYGPPDIAGGEFFFPLADCPAITGKYPIFGKVTAGREVLRTLEGVETRPVSYPGLPDVQINTPVEPVVIRRVTVDTFGTEYGEPVRLSGVEKPYFWPAIQSGQP